MDSVTTQASAFDKMAQLSDERSNLHALRFAYVKMHRATLDVQRILRENGRLSEERCHVIEAVLTDAMFQRTLLWHEIEALDEQIQRLMHQLQEGVFSHE